MTTLRDLVEAAQDARMLQLTEELDRMRAMTAEAYLSTYSVELCPRDIPGAAWSSVREHSDGNGHITIEWVRGKPGLRCNANTWEWYARGIWAKSATPWLDLALDADVLPEAER